MSVEAAMPSLAEFNAAVDGFAAICFAAFVPCVVFGFGWYLWASQKEAREDFLRNLRFR